MDCRAWIKQKLKDPRTHANCFTWMILISFCLVLVALHLLGVSIQKNRGAQIEMNNTMHNFQLDIRMRIDQVINDTRADLDSELKEMKDNVDGKLKDFVQVNHLNTDLCKLRTLENGSIHSLNFPNNYSTNHEQVVYNWKFSNV